MAPLNPAAVKLNITPAIAGSNITPTKVGSNITKHKASRHDVSILRSLGMSQSLAYMYAARGATPESLKEYADFKLSKLYDSWKIKLRFEDELKAAGAFSPNKGSRTAMRLYFRYLHNFEKNKGLYLDPKNVILNQTDDAYRRKIQSQGTVSTLRGPEFWEKAFTLEAAKPENNNGYNVVDPQLFTKPVIDNYLRAAQQQPVVHDPKFIAITDELRHQEGFPIHVHGARSGVVFKSATKSGYAVHLVHPNETILSLALRLGVDVKLAYFTSNGRIIETTFGLEGVKRGSNVEVNYRLPGGMESVRCAECWMIDCICDSDFGATESRIKRPCSVCSSFSDVCLCPGPKQHEAVELIEADRFCTIRFHGKDQRFRPLPQNFADLLIETMQYYPSDDAEVYDNCPPPIHLRYMDCFYITVSFTVDGRWNRYVFDWRNLEKDFDGSFYHPDFPYRPGMIVEVCTRLSGGSHVPKRRPGKVKCRGCGKTHPPPFDECMRMKKLNDKAHRERERLPPDVPQEQPDAPRPLPPPPYDTTRVDCINVFEVKTSEVMIYAKSGNAWEHAQIISALYHFPIWSIFSVLSVEFGLFCLLLYPVGYFWVTWYNYIAYALFCFPISFRISIVVIRAFSRLLVCVFGLEVRRLSPVLFHPLGPLYLPDGNLYHRERTCFEVSVPGVPNPRILRTDYEILNNDYMNLMYLSISRSFVNPFARLTFLLACFTVIYEQAKFINVSKIGLLPYDTQSDERAIGVGLTDFKKTQHHRIVRYMVREGNESLYSEREIFVSMTQVAQIYGLPALHNPSLSLTEIDNLVEFNYKNLHVINLPMHLNLAHSVCMDTKMFIKLLIRNERFRCHLGGKVSKCPLPTF
jgi:hypothetical protein